MKDRKARKAARKNGRKLDMLLQANGLTTGKQKQTTNQPNQTIVLMPVPVPVTRRVLVDVVGEFIHTFNINQDNTAQPPASQQTATPATASAAT